MHLVETRHSLASALQGLAKELVSAAETMAAHDGASHLYVHVEVDNDAATALYRACGFAVEVEERVELARKRQHTPRLLLGKAAGAP